MSDGSSRRLTRRELMRVAGLSAVAVGGAALVAPMAKSAAIVNASDTPEGFLNFAFTQRERAATTGDPALLDDIYDSANTSLIRFERERARYLAGGIGAVWGGTFLDHSASIALSRIQRDGDTVTAQLYETLTSRWVPNPRTPTTEERALQAQSPLKYRDTTPRGPRGEIESVAVIPHEVRLVRGRSGWRIGTHQHDEFFLGGKSPDLIPGSWAAIREGKDHQVRTGVSAQKAPAGLKGPGLARPLQTQYTYDWNAAVWYARTYAVSPYPMYCNYDVCGGDCTNFVSQCFRQGGQVDQVPWYTVA